ncbi:hypothetical protein QUF90_26075 [Desulfococcaceae bacterium HSG9]|nr:hypothetical protein [Desulfococcaceae bacterium HSG9]
MKQKRVLKIKEYPNIEDQRLYEYSFHVQTLQSDIERIIKRVIKRSKDVKITIGLVVSILSRIQECVTSIQLLSLKGRWRDASILLLNVIELRVDCQYIALDSTREVIWLKHDNSWHKPWKFDKQLKEIFPDKSEKESEHHMYHMFSMIKHGSPASVIKSSFDNNGNWPNMSFQILLVGESLQVETGDQNHLLPIALIGAAFNLAQASKAGIKILRKYQIDCNDLEKQIEIHSSQLSEYLSNDMTDILLKQKMDSDPEFKQKMKEFDEKEEYLKQEKDKAKNKLTKLRKQMEKLEEEYGFLPSSS